MPLVFHGLRTSLSACHAARASFFCYSSMFVPGCMMPRNVNTLAHACRRASSHPVVCAMLLARPSPRSSLQRRPADRPPSSDVLCRWKWGRDWMPPRPPPDDDSCRLCAQSVNVFVSMAIMERTTTTKTTMTTTANTTRANTSNTLAIAPYHVWGRDIAAMYCTIRARWRRRVRKSTSSLLWFCCVVPALLPSRALDRIHVGASGPARSPPPSSSPVGINLWKGPIWPDLGLCVGIIYNSCYW